MTGLPTAPQLRVADGQLCAYLNPCAASEARRYARVLRQLLSSLDGEIVVAALVGDREGDLLDPERQEMDRVREFLDGRIAMRTEPTDLRGRALTVLDTFADQVEAATDHSESPYGARALTRYVAGAFLAASRQLQRKAGVRRAASAARPSGVTEGGAWRKRETRDRAQLQADWPPLRSESGAWVVDVDRINHLRGVVGLPVVTASQLRDLELKFVDRQDDGNQHVTDAVSVGGGLAGSDDPGDVAGEVRSDRSVALLGVEQLRDEAEVSHDFSPSSVGSSPSVGEPSASGDQLQAHTPDAATLGGDR